MANCVLCGNPCISIDERPERRQMRFECDNCGVYLTTSDYLKIDRAIKRNIIPEKWILSGLSRYLKEHDKKPLNLYNFTETKTSLFQIRIPQTPLEKIDMLLDYFYKASDYFDKTIKINPDSEYPICFAKNPEEMKGLIRVAREQKYIVQSPPHKQIGHEIGMHHILSVKGWERVDELRKKKPKGNQCFIAMWFNNSMKDAFENGILRALDETHYEPIRIDTKQFERKICDEIIAEIRKSSLVIVDVTGQRLPVHYEAGFAHGLNIPVIFTCDNTKKNDIKENFDIRQYPHILWNNSDDLKKQLIDKIEALYPIRKNKK